MSHLLPRNVPNPSLRQQEIYQVDQARTTRLVNSPVNAMARLLNAQNIFDNTSKK